MVAREKQELVTREPHQNYKLISLQKPCRPERSGKIYSKFWKGNTYNLGYSTQPDYHLARILYLARLPFRTGEIKNFPGKQKLKEYTNINLYLKKYWKIFSK